MARLFVILTDGKIPELGNIRGPVQKPTELKVSDVISMMNRGVTVDEVNPANYAERVRMTFSNVNSKNFLSVKKAAPKAATKPQVESIPAGRSNVVVETANEAKAAKETRDNKSWKNNGKNVTPVIKSDF